jgi:hypothetical protein
MREAVTLFGTVTGSRHSFGFHQPVIRAPKGHESTAQGLPWVCCFIAARPEGAPESKLTEQRDPLHDVAEF